MNKEGLSQELYAVLEDKLEQLRALIAQTRSSNVETKSAMGDKYETGAEMLGQQINQLLLREKVLLDQIHDVKGLPKGKASRIERGAVVRTEMGYFYLSTSGVNIKLEGQEITCISMDSPLSGALMGKHCGESFSLRDKTYTVLEIY